MAQSAQIAKVSPVHQRLADWLIADGGKKGWNKRAAEEFGYTQAWLSTIYHSDAFQDYFASLSQGHSQALALGIRDKTIGVAGQALDQIGERLSGDDVISYDDLLQTADVMLRRAGYGLAPREGGPVVQNNISIPLVTSEELAKAREAMRAPRELKVIDPPKEDVK